MGAQARLGIRREHHDEFRAEKEAAERKRKTTITAESFGAGGAVGALMRSADPLGFDVIVPRPIRTHEVLRVCSPRKAVGWRYRPDAHRTRPCPCRVCLPRSTIESRRLRRRLDPTGERF
jgi:hypothetical protein